MHTWLNTIENILFSENLMFQQKQGSKPDFFPWVT